MLAEPMKMIATYNNAAEMQTALALLSEEGIEVMTSTAGATAATFGQTPTERFLVAVPLSRADEALRLLKEVSPLPLPGCQRQAEQGRPEYEATEVIADFINRDAASPALTVLRAQGIRAMLSGEEPNLANFLLFGGLQCEPIQLAVAPEQAEDALRILKHLDSSPEARWEETAEQAIDGWLCSSCDTVVSQEADICPGCGSLKSEQPVKACAVERVD